MRMKKSLYGITMSLILCCSTPTMAFADDVDATVSEQEAFSAAVQENTENSYGTEGQEPLPLASVQMKKRMDFSFYKKTDSSLYRNDRVITCYKIPDKAESAE